MTLTLCVIRVAVLALLAAPLAAGAQPGKVYRLGLLYGSSPAFNPESDPSDKAFVQGLRENGYVLGQHLAIEFRSALGRPERLPGLAAELVRLPVDMIVTSSTAAALAAKGATSNIPIVMMGVSDPVGRGLVASLARPGGNVTGLTNNPGAGWDSKMLELLKEAAPRVSRVVLVHSGAAPELGALKALEMVGPGLGVTILTAEVRDPDGLAEAFAAIVRQRADALFVTPSPLNYRLLQRIVEFATANRLPTMFGDRAYVDAGGLMSYWTSWNDLSRRAAYYVAKILKGAKPADLPVEQPTKFELVINLRTAKALGLTIPPAVLARADEVIQ
jgi:putative ABC transport system substrate-binding protein